MTAFSVARRRREIGLRIALGADPRGVVRLILRRSVELAVAGIVLGVLASLAVTRLLQQVLYEVSATDPIVFAGVPLFLAAVASVAAFWPASRASGRRWR